MTKMSKWASAKLCIAFALQLALVGKDVITAGQLSGGTGGINTKQESGKGIVSDLTGLMSVGEDLNKTLSKSSSLVYIVAYDNVYNDTCWIDKIGERRCGEQYGITSLSLLLPYQQVQLVSAIQTSGFNNNTIVTLMKGHQDDGSTIYSLIISITGHVQGQNLCGCRFYYLARFLTAELKLGGYDDKILKINFPVKLGLEYGERDIDCCFDTEQFQRFDVFGLAVMRVELSPREDLLSYGLFSQKLDALVQKNRQFVDKVTPEGTLYVRLVFRSGIPNNISDKVNTRFRAMISDYVRAWQEEHNATEIFIMEPFLSENIALTKRNNNEFLRARLVPNILVSGKGVPGDYDDNTGKMQGLPSSFRNIIVQFLEPNIDPMSTFSSLGPISSLTKANLSISIRFSSYSREAARVLEDNAHRFNISTIYLVLDSTQTSSWNTSTINELENMMQRKNIQIGCAVRIISFSSSENSSVYANQIKRKCGQLFNVSSKILYRKEINGAKGPEDFIQELESLEQERQVIQETFPGKEASPVIYLEKGKPEISSIYCSKDQQKYEEFYNIIIAFANIHDWPAMYLRPLISESYQSLWRFIKTNHEIEKLYKSATVYVRTNEGKPMGKDAHFPYMYPCIQRTTEEPEKEIGFLKNSYSGTTLHMDLKPQTTSLDVRELETLMLFAFTKFPTVELVAKNEKDVLVATEVLTANFVQYIQRVHDKGSASNLVYLEIPIDLAYPSENTIAKLPNNVVAVHFSGWENYADITHHRYHINLKTLLGAKRSIGITVQDCVEEINLNLTRMSTTIIPILPVVNYIVCDAKPVRPDNSAEKYLNTMFYIKTYIEKFHPQLEVYFRLNFQDEKLCSRKKFKVGRFLKFLNDVQQHASAYKIRYFIVNAFEQEERRDKCSHTWWRIHNYTDLSIVSVYTDIEDDNLGQETELKLKPPRVESKEKSVTTNVSTVVTISVLSVLLFLSFLIFCIYRNRTKKKLLTLKEIHEFYNGVLDNNSDDENHHHQEDHSRWLGIGFPEMYQIAKNRIEIGRLIGSGEFGKVFIGILDQQIEVAIKVPRDDASVEIFKSALSEVKILRYVGDGSHPNVIAFLGAYTKEISEGKLYILTEYCHNGSLLDYLKALQPKGRAASASVDMYQLYGFAVEIASGMEFIAEKKVIHGDLAARNVLLNSDNTCKIGDFGLSRKLYEYTKYTKKSQQPLPWRWMAVESLKNMEFTSKSDVWSYGVTVWEILGLGGIPYPGLSWSTGFANQLVDGVRLEKAEHSSDVIHEMLLKCWRMEPEARPTFGELAQYFIDLRRGSDTYTALHEVDSSYSNQLVAESKM